MIKHRVDKTVMKSRLREANSEPSLNSLALGALLLLCDLGREVASEGLDARDHCAKFHAAIGEVLGDANEHFKHACVLVERRLGTVVVEDLTE